MPPRSPSNAPTLTSPRSRPPRSRSPRSNPPTRAPRSISPSNALMSNPPGSTEESRPLLTSIGRVDMTNGEQVSGGTVRAPSTSDAAPVSGSKGTPVSGPLTPLVRFTRTGPTEHDRSTPPSSGPRPSPLRSTATVAPSSKPRRTSCPAGETTEPEVGRRYGSTRSDTGTPSSPRGTSTTGRSTARSSTMSRPSASTSPSIQTHAPASAPQDGSGRATPEPARSSPPTIPIFTGPGLATTEATGGAGGDSAAAVDGTVSATSTAVASAAAVNLLMRRC